MSVFKCKMCGGDLRADDQAAIGTCQKDIRERIIRQYKTTGGRYTVRPFL